MYMKVVENRSLFRDNTSSMYLIVKSAMYLSTSLKTRLQVKTKANRSGVMHSWCSLVFRQSAGRYSHRNQTNMLSMKRIIIYNVVLDVHHHFLQSNVVRPMVPGLKDTDWLKCHLWPIRKGVLCCYVNHDTSVFHFPHLASNGLNITIPKYVNATSLLFTSKQIGVCSLITIPMNVIDFVCVSSSMV